MNGATLLTPVPAMLLPDEPIVFRQTPQPEPSPSGKSKGATEVPRIPISEATLEYLVTSTNSASGRESGSKSASDSHRKGAHTPIPLVIAESFSLSARSHHKPSSESVQKEEAKFSSTPPSNSARILAHEISVADLMELLQGQSPPQSGRLALSNSPDGASAASPSCTKADTLMSQPLTLPPAQLPISSSSVPESSHSDPVSPTAHPPSSSPSSSEHSSGSANPLSPSHERRESISEQHPSKPVSPTGRVLLLDVRPHLFFEQSHVAGAISVQFKMPQPPAAVDRSNSAAAAEALRQLEVSITDDGIARLFRSRRGAAVIVYDSSSTDVSAEGPAPALTRLLAAENLVSDVSLLKGGFSAAQNGGIPLESGASSARGPAINLRGLFGTSRAPIPILPGRLYLGHAKNAANLTELKQLNISHILNTCEHPCEYFPNAFYYFHRADPPTGVDREDPVQLLSQMLDFIDRGTKAGTKHGCLVYCNSGKGLAAYLCLVYLVHSNTCSIEKAEEVLKTKAHFRLDAKSRETLHEVFTKPSPTNSEGTPPTDSEEVPTLRLRRLISAGPDATTAKGRTQWSCGTLG